MQGSSGVYRRLLRTYLAPQLPRGVATGITTGGSGVY
jgi:hypothetical protein